MESKDGTSLDVLDVKYGPGWLFELPATPPVAIPTSESSSPAPATSLQAPEPIPWRSVVAGWPLAWRQQWGDRSNALEATGLGWREAERQAFEEMTTED